MGVAASDGTTDAEMLGDVRTVGTLEAGLVEDARTVEGATTVGDATAGLFDGAMPEPALLPQAATDRASAKAVANMAMLLG